MMVSPPALLAEVERAVEALEDALLLSPSREEERALCNYLLRQCMYLMGRQRGLTQPWDQARYLAGTLMTWVEQSMPYEEYLRTDHWRVTRMAALDRADHRCMVCYRPDSLEVHHRTYQHLWHEQPSDLTVLCAACHARHHGYAQ